MSTTATDERVGRLPSRVAWQGGIHFLIALALLAAVPLALNEVLHDTFFSPRYTWLQHGEPMGWVSSALDEFFLATPYWASYQPGWIIGLLPGLLVAAAAWGLWKQRVWGRQLAIGFHAVIAVVALAAIAWAVYGYGSMEWPWLRGDRGGGGPDNLSGVIGVLYAILGAAGFGVLVVAGSLLWWLRRPATRSCFAMSKCYAWLNILFNVLVGGLAAFGGSILAVLAIGFGDSPAEVLAVVGPLIVGGLLYASSGIILWWSRPSVPGKALIVQGLAVLLGLAYCLTMFGATEYDPYNEEHRLFMAIPAFGVLLVSIQWVYLFSKWLRPDACRPGEDTTADKSGPPQVKRRWYQFRVRTLIMVAVVAFVAVAWIGSMANDRRIISELRELGPASAFYAWGYVQTVELHGRNEDVR